MPVIRFITIISNLGVSSSAQSHVMHTYCAICVGRQVYTSKDEAAKSDFSAFEWFIMP